MTVRTLIIGSGPCTDQIATALLAAGMEVCIAAKDEPVDLPLTFPGDGNGYPAEILGGARILSCRGVVGDFKVTLERTGETFCRTAANIIIAEEAESKPNFSLYNLVPSSNVISISEVADFFNTAEGKMIRHPSSGVIVFLSGLVEESHPVITEKIMRHGLQLQQDAGLQTFILTQNLKVAGDGLEALYRETKRAGATYIKFARTTPRIHQDKEGRVSIEFTDELTRQAFCLNPDLTVVDETVSAGEYLTNLAEIFGLDRDPDGFVQTGNVHRMCTLTNRKGIIVAGPARQIQSPEYHIIDAGNAAISAIELVRGNVVKTEKAAEIEPGRCARCLTCYRCCPHRAIALDIRPKIIKQACEGCAICIAECPALAIHMEGYDLSPTLGHTSNRRPRSGQEPFVPFLIIFCCSRSASRARALATSMGYKLPQDFKVIEVPCAGSISMSHIFTAFEQDADGVLILTCHEGNCHSEKGNIYAQRRVDTAIKLFSKVGFEKERLKVDTIASNMGKEFADFSTGLEKTLYALGPSRLKSDF